MPSISFGCINPSSFSLINKHLMQIKRTFHNLLNTKKWLWIQTRLCFKGVIQFYVLFWQFGCKHCEAGKSLLFPMNSSVS